MRILPVLLPLVAIATLAFTAAGGAGGLPPDRLLGVRLGMTDQEARAALVKIGAVTRGADTRRQTWEIRDPRYRYLVVRLDDEWRVKWMTVFARPGGRSIRYRDVGDLSRGHRVGYYSWVWTLPA